LRQRRLHKAFLRYHDPNNWPVLREALRRMGKARLIGNGPQHLIPAWQPAGTGDTGEGKRAGFKHGTQGAPQARRTPVPGSSAARAAPSQPMRTQHTGLPHTPRPPAANKGEPRWGGKSKRK
jgi:hypothetical protein